MKKVLEKTKSFTVWQQRRIYDHVKYLWTYDRALVQKKLYQSILLGCLVPLAEDGKIGDSLLLWTFGNISHTRRKLSQAIQSFSMERNSKNRFLPRAKTILNKKRQKSGNYFLKIMQLKHYACGTSFTHMILFIDVSIFQLVLCEIYINK